MGGGFGHGKDFTRRVSKDERILSSPFATFDNFSVAL